MSDIGISFVIIVFCFLVFAMLRFDIKAIKIFFCACFVILGFSAINELYEIYKVPEDKCGDGGDYRACVAAYNKYIDGKEVRYNKSEADKFRYLALPLIDEKCFVGEDDNILQRTIKYFKNKKDREIRMACAAGYWISSFDEAIKYGYKACEMGEYDVCLDMANTYKAKNQLQIAKEFFGEACEGMQSLERPDIFADKSEVVEFEAVIKMRDDACASYKQIAKGE